MPMIRFVSVLARAESVDSWGITQEWALVGSTFCRVA